MSIPKSTYPPRDAAYYQRFHEQDLGYQTNNWLLDEIERILSFGASSILELACGNGRFLECAAPLFGHVYGCDWAVSPRIEGVLAANSNTTFFRVDIYKDLPPCQAELVVSADFLEHLSPDALPEVLRRIDSLSTKAFHKIACYDDGHSHLSILPPARWLELFRTINLEYSLERVELRTGNPDLEIAVFSKGRPFPISAGVDQILTIVESLLREGFYDDASETLRQGMTQHPGNFSLRIASANLMLAQGQADDAIGALLSTIDSFPAEPLGYVNLSGALFRVGKNREAIDAAMSAYRLSPKNPDVLLLFEVLALDPEADKKTPRESMSPDKLDVVRGSPRLCLHYGCGDIRMEGYLGIDIRPCAGADMCFPAWDPGPFEAGSVDEIYSRHMLEHMDPSEGYRTLVTWHSLLRKGGLLRLIVPDLRFHALQLLGRIHSWNDDPKQNLEHAMAGFYGWRDPTRGGSEYDAHRWGYTWESLSGMLTCIGFTDITRVVNGVDSDPWHLHVLARKPV